MPHAAAPPRPERRPETRRHHGHEVVDPYAWLRDPDDPATLPHLRAENAWTEQVTAPLAGLRDELFAEIERRTQEDDTSVPVREGAWWYHQRTEKGRSYPIRVRRADDGTGTGPTGPEQVVLDVNDLVEEGGYLGLGVLDVSPDGNLLAYAVDRSGDERHDLHVRDLRTGAEVADVLREVSYGFAPGRPTPPRSGTRCRTTAPGPTGCCGTWSAPTRPTTCWSCTSATNASTSRSTEPARRPWRWCRSAARSRASRGCSTPPTPTPSRWWWPPGSRTSSTPSPTTRPASSWRRTTTGPRTSPCGGHRSTARPRPPARPGRACSLTGPGRGSTGSRPSPTTSSSTGGPTASPRYWRLDPTTGEIRRLATDEPGGTIAPGANPTFATDTYRLSYQSSRTPPSVFDEDLRTGARVLRKQLPVLDGFDPADYETRLERAVADDGTEIPISLVWRTDARPADGPAPLLLYGYGAYEASMDPWFSIARLSLLDRGVVFAIAHVRGGGELGRHWYEDGKFGRKEHTFTDFVACARHLVATGTTAPDRLAARGGSAGGLLMGAVANLAPELFRAIVAEVPFVDPLTTMLDPSLPLTVIEREEWGDPLHDPAAYDWIAGYSPYENVAEGVHPAILATAGLSDPRVGFHEPTKWVARLRDRSSTAADASLDGRPVLLKVELGAGHAGPSGRYDAWRDEAFVLAFVLRSIAAGALTPDRRSRP